MGELPYVGLEDISNATGEFLGSYQSRSMKSTTFQFTSKHVLYGRLRPYLNKALLPDFEGHCSSEIFPIRPNKDLDRRYLFYWLTWPETCNRIAATETGARMPRANMKEVMAFDIPLPPLDEQKRIVAVLDQAFAALDRARAFIETNLADAKSLFMEALGRRVATQIDNYGSIKVDQLSEHITDGDHQAPPKVDTGVPFITISNIEKSSRRIDFTKTFYVPRTYYEKLSPKRRPNYGDILYSVTGSFGIPVLVKNYPEFCFQRHIGLIRPNEYTNSDWLHFMLMSPQCFEQADAAATGTAQRTVSLKALRALQVPDTPPQEQSRIASEISQLYGVCFERVAQYELKLKDLEELRRSVLNRAFSGQLS